MGHAQDTIYLQNSRVVMEGDAASPDDDGDSCYYVADVQQLSWSFIAVFREYYLPDLETIFCSCRSRYSCL